MAAWTVAPSQSGNKRPNVSARLQSLARAVEKARTRRKFDVRQIMLILGATAIALGFVAIVLGWLGAANSVYVFQEIPYLISGGLLGVALMAGGGFVFFAAWLVRMIEENRRQAARMNVTLDRVDRLLDAMMANGSIAPPPPASAGSSGPASEGGPA
ncbi:MAG: hypothetical protein ACYDD4_06045 [Acidimicrobiales bacterium]